MSRKVEIVMDTMIEDNQTFSLDGCVGFSVENAGVTVALFGYDGSGRPFDLPPGETRVFQLPSGYEFHKTMSAQFKTTGKGLLKITKFVLSL
ncbi:hypothetical protein [Flammeovirga sp. EKP202]|uniref:hypothetical protein n=1 Tax=Flammeovirga sp. EKP202 TaxID=2770592 RepID=UPI00165F57E7|nr:hypothetical protein [Flammeovirga sp. EKP202]MBD0403210.1 hypothetical protein [Flammeovirga sp. EKP202]